MSTPLDRHAGPPYDDTPRRKKKPGCLMWLLGTLILLVILASCGAILGGDNDTADPAPQETTAPQTVGPPPEEEPEPTPEETEEAAMILLEATAPEGGTVVWGADGSTRSEPIQGTWSMEVPDDGLYTLFVSGDFQTTAEVTCTITMDGEVVDQATGSGDLGSASCTQPLW